MYEYKATLDRVVDGDTVDLIVDLGFRVKAHHRFRLINIDAPEPRGVTREPGLKASSFLTELLADKSLVVHSTKTGKYGRWLAQVWNGVDADDVSSLMIKAGHAIRSV
jgi:micrococcal nuclease